MTYVTCTGYSADGGSTTESQAAPLSSLPGTSPAQRPLWEQPPGWKPFPQQELCGWAPSAAENFSFPQSMMASWPQGQRPSDHPGPQKSRLLSFHRVTPESLQPQNG